MQLQTLFTVASLSQLLHAAPVEEASDLSPSRTKHARQLDLGNIVGPVVTSVLSGLAADATDGAAIVSAILQAAEDTLGNQIPGSPTDVPAAVSALSSVFAAAPTDLITNILELIPAGFPVDEIVNLVGASVDPRNSINNANPPPPDVIYPNKDPRDAPYDLTEEQLRQVIYIPSTFTFGQKQPVILVPGTGNTGFQTFIGNYIPLLTGVDYADPVWLNIPGQLLGDAQTHAEYVAYAVNYISSITGNKNNVNVLTWSQGGIDAQWAFKYWPSTRNVTQNLIANSADYAGTVLAYAICPEFPQLPCEPAVLQQASGSNFIATLRNNGGDSAFVPTTNVYSATDEIVQPQSPLTGASGYLKDTCSIGVTNVLIQDTCGGRGVGGTFYTHEGVLYSSLGVALAIDALKNGRPGRVSDLDLDFVCAQYLGQGLDLINLLTTEESILIAALSIVLYQPKVFNEPAIKAYANNAVVPACSATSSSSSTMSTSTRSTTSYTVTSSATATSKSTVTGTSTRGGPHASETTTRTHQTLSPTKTFTVTVSSSSSHHGHATHTSSSTASRATPCICDYSDVNCRCAAVSSKPGNGHGSGEEWSDQESGWTSAGYGIAEPTSTKTGGRCRRKRTLA